MPHEKFHYKSLEEVQAKAAELGVSLPFAADTHILATPLTTGKVTFPNRLGIAPMEGADSTPEGAPSDYTVRRYVNEAIGGSSVIWFEAISIVEEGRSSKTQLLLTRDTLDEFKKMTAAVKEAGIKANGFAPYLIMQANHSGRYSNPGNKPAPMIAYRHPILEQYRAADDSCIVTDDYLKGLEEKFGEAAQLAKEAGFDAIDIKSCHGYLLAELASAYNRPGEYGGSFENRFRLLKNGIRAAKVYEDDMVYAFRDIAPMAPTHILIGPKAHIASADEVAAENSGYVARIFEVIPKIAATEGLTNGYRVITNCGEDGCQSVKHLHFHLLGGKKLPDQMA